MAPSATQEWRTSSLPHSAPDGETSGPFSGVPSVEVAVSDAGAQLASGHPLETTSGGAEPCADRPRSLFEASWDPSEGDVSAIRRHLSVVLERLRARDVVGLTPEQRARREEHLERLVHYRDEGIFPHNDVRTGLTPIFIDDAGRACAVGYLMIESGARELAERVAAVQNYAYVPEITVPGVAQWIEESGLAAEECALIQPSYPSHPWHSRGGMVGFWAVPRDGAAPLTVNFQEASFIRGSFAWDFGDGETSTEANPSHVYTSPGLYTVTLTCTNAFVSLTARYRDFVRVRPLVADFSATPRSGSVPQTVSFTDLSMGSPISWSWDFGDGNTSSLQNPTHVYTIPGYYTVSLTSSNELGSDTKTRSSYLGFLYRSEQAKLIAGDARTVDIFGTCVAVSGAKALVGSPWDDHPGRQNAGSAYVYRVERGVWTEEARLQASDHDSFDDFGHSVALDGDTALIGAVSDEGGTANWGGSAYVFTRGGGGWAQEAKLIPSDRHAYNGFGRSVALAGDTALVGANIRPDFGGTDPGAAYVFSRSAGAWSEVAKLVAVDSPLDNGFGRAVSLFGDTALVGALDDDDMGANAGAAYVFVFDGTTWNLQAKLFAGDAQPGDAFGGSVALYGDTALVGAHLDDTGGGILTENGGSAYVFVRDGTTWTEQAKLVADDAGYWDFFGCSVALAADRAVLGAYGDQSGAGSAYVFARNGIDWTQEGKLRPQGASSYNAYSFFGSSVALSGETTVIGSPRDDEAALDAGAAYAFALSPAATVTHRNAGTNPDSYTASAPLLGRTFTGTVDLSTTGHDFALLFGFDTPATRLLPGGQALLCGPAGGVGRTWGPGGSSRAGIPLGGADLFRLGVRPGPVAVFTFIIPNDPQLYGLSLSTQALHFGGAQPFALSNAQDLALGF